LLILHLAIVSASMVYSTEIYWNPWSIQVTGWSSRRSRWRYMESNGWKQHIYLPE